MERSGRGAAEAGASGTGCDVTALVREGRLNEAAEVLVAAIARGATSELWNDLAVVRMAEAERAFGNALRLDPWNGEAMANLGVLLFCAGRVAEAEPFLREAVEAAEGAARDRLEAMRRICAPEEKRDTRANGTAGIVPAAARRDVVVEGDVDLAVQEAFFADQGYRGTMVEVGAAKPEYLSVSATFRKRGWRVISIEPNPFFCELQRAKGHDVIECACGAEDADGAPFFVVKMDTTYQGEAVTNESFSSLGVRGKYAEMMKTLAKSVATSVEEIQVKVRRLDTVLQEHAGDVCEIDLVCVDVEGWELEVLGGLTFEKYRPKVLIVENLFLEKAYVEFLEERGYRLWRRIEPNDVFVRRDWRGGAERTQHRGSDG